MTAGANKPGLTLQPPYTGWFQVQMDPHMSQNGALWDWWAGRQVSGEFWSGYWSLARDHLLQIPGVEEAGVELVYEPPWTPERMTEDARWELGMV